MAFHDNLKKARESARISQKEIADRIGIAASTYSLYESGKRTPSTPVMQRIAEYLGISTDTLLGIEEKFSIAPGNISDEESKMYALKIMMNSFDYDLTLRGDMYQLRGDNGFNDVEKEDLDSIFSSASSFIEVETKKLDKRLTRAALYAAHERTDTEYSDAKQAHDDTVMDGEDF